MLAGAARLAHATVAVVVMLLAVVPSVAAAAAVVVVLLLLLVLLATAIPLTVTTMHCHSLRSPPRRSLESAPPPLRRRSQAPVRRRREICGASWRAAWVRLSDTTEERLRTLWRLLLLPCWRSRRETHPMQCTLLVVALVVAAVTAAVAWMGCWEGNPCAAWTWLA